MTKLTKSPKISSCLWFDKEAEEAANFYTSIFKNTTIEEITHYGKAGYEIHGRPAGSVMTIEFQLEGQSFIALNGGPHFKFTPAISFFVNCETENEVDHLWSMLSDGGKILMPLEKYPFSEKYGWTEDRFGLSWQVILSEEKSPQKIVPSMLFVDDKSGQAEAALNFYQSVFKDSKVGTMARYGPNQTPDVEGTLMFADFVLEGQWFAAMDSAREHGYSFSEATSFVVNCEDQEEVDNYWEKLSAVPEAEQCGWLKDKYGVSWQVVPIALNEWMNDSDPEKAGRVMEAMLQMKKMDIEKLKKAYN